MSSNGRCFDIGNTVRTALYRFERTHKVYPSEMAAGNGSLMRLCPVPLCWSENPERAIEYSDESSRTSTTFEEGCRLAVNLGGDADTCGAVFGQLAGAHYGECGIPERSG